MAVPTTGHLAHQLLMPRMQRGQLARPAQGLGVHRVPAPPLCQDDPQGVQLAMLAKQVLPAQNTWRQIPDSHHGKLSPSLHTLMRSVLALVLVSHTALSQGKPRARELGIPLDGTPGPLDAITDVRGVEVGHTTLISGSGRLVVGRGPVRT